MRLDSANRSFTALVVGSLVLGVYLFCGAVGCVLVPLIVSRVSHHGVGGLVEHGHSLLAAVAFVALAGVGAVRGRSLLKQVAASCALSERVRALALALPAELRAVAQEAGLAGRVVLVDSAQWFSFVYGALSPRVAVSRALLEGASAEELRAVLEHERYHVRNLDPLKVLIARTLPATFYFLPVLAALRARYVAGRELAADRRTVRVCGRKPLVRALLKVVRGPAWSELEVAAAIGGSELLDLRISQLEDGREPHVVVLSVAALALSLLGGLLFLAAFVASIAGFGGPSAISRATGMDVSVTGVLASAMCVVPFALGGLIVYRWVAWRARDPLTDSKDTTTLP